MTVNLQGLNKAQLHTLTRVSWFFVSWLTMQPLFSHSMSVAVRVCCLFAVAVILPNFVLKIIVPDLPHYLVFFIFANW